MTPIRHSIQWNSRSNSSSKIPPPAAEIHFFDLYSPLGCVKIFDSGVVVYDYKRLLAKNDLKQILKTTKTALKKIFSIEYQKPFNQFYNNNLSSAFRDAIASGNLVFVEELLGLGYDINESYAGHSFLYHALADRHFLLARALFKRGALLNSEERNADTLCDLLLGFIKQPATTQVFERIAQGKALPLFPEGNPLKDINEIFFFLDDFLKVLSPEEQIELYEELLDKIPLLSDVRFTEELLKRIPLENRKECFDEIAWPAALCAPLSYCQFLIEAGVSPSIFLKTAGRYGRNDLLKLLIQYDVDVTENQGVALKLALIADHLSTVHLLMDLGVNASLLPRPGNFYATSLQAVNLNNQHQPKEIFQYYSCLLLFAHLFQIKYQAHDPLLSGYELSGMLDTAFPSFLDTYRTRALPGACTQVWTSWIDDPLFKITKEFSHYLTRSPWQKQASAAITEIPYQLRLPSEKLYALHQKNLGIALYTGWNEKGLGHSTFMWIENSILFHANTGQRGQDKEAGITFYYIPDQKQLSPQIIEKLRKQNRTYIEKRIIEALNLEKIGVLSSQDQKGNFCHIRSFFLLLKGILFIKHMGKIESKEAFHKRFQETKKMISPLYKVAKERVMDFELSQLLSLYESKELLFQQEIPLLLMTLAKLPPRSLQRARLMRLLKLGNASIEMKASEKTIFHYLNHRANLDAMEALFGVDVVQNATEKFINQTSENQDSPLAAAIKENRLSSIKILLKLGAKVDGESINQSPLHIACLKPGDTIARLLLEKGADPLQQVEEKITPLQFAVLKGRKDLVALMLTFIPESEKPQVVEEIFIYAAQIKATPLLSFLLTCGVDTASKVCINEEMFKYLLQNGMELFQRDQNNVCLLEGVILLSRIDLLEAILETTLHRPAILQRSLEYAIAKGKTEVLSWLLKEGADPNTPDALLTHPLILACNSIQQPLEGVKLLLEAGAEPLWVPEDFKWFLNPLQWAALKDKVAILQQMLTSFDSKLHASLAKNLLSMGRIPVEGKAYAFLSQLSC